MSKIFLFICCFLSSICLQGQVIKDGIFIHLDGNYNETGTSNMLHFVNAYETTSKNGSAFLSAGYMYRHWLLGLGFEYNRNKTEAQGGLFEQSNIATTVFMEQNTTTLNMYGGTFYTSYYLPVWRNLYFTPGFYIGYGTVKGDYSGKVGAMMQNISTSLMEDSSYTHSGSYKQDISKSYFYVQLSPELTWSFSNHFGVNLQMEGWELM